MKTLNAILVLGLCALSVSAEDVAKEIAKPLFPVQLDHEFAGAPAAFEEVKRLILDNYYVDVSEEALYWAAIEGMLRHISPPEHPTLGKLMKPSEFKEFYDSLQGVEESIGIESSFNAAEGSLTINNIPEGSPSVGILRLLDRIMRIDGVALKGRAASDVTDLLHGKAGTNVALTVVRDIEVLELTVRRQRFEVENLVILELKEKTAYVGISRFTADISERITTELKALQEKGIDKLIIDLRNNSGGVFTEALRVSELFLPKQSIVLRSSSHGASVKNYVSGNEKPFDFKIALVVNTKTASSCEIFAAAMQDHCKAVIVGEHTYGKAVFEKTFSLKNNCRAKFIIGSMHSPKGKTWHNKGVLPDYFVYQKEETCNALAKLPIAERCAKDTQLITAYRVLNRN